MAEKKVTQRKAERQERKDVRQTERQSDRQGRKDARKEKINTQLSDVVTRQAKKYGVDLDAPPTAPLSASRKIEIDKEIESGVGKEKWDKLNYITETSKPPTMESATKPTKEDLMESARKQRGMRWADALTAFGQGLKGRVVDPESLHASKYRRERDAQFQEYKGVTERNRNTQQLWENQYQKEIISSLREIENNEAKSKEARIKAKERADELETKTTADAAKTEVGRGLKQQEIDARLAGKWNANRITSTKADAKSKIPSTDKYYELPGSSPAIISEFAKLSGEYQLDEDGNLVDDLKDEDKERISNKILKRMFKVKLDDNGNKTYTPIPGMENYLSDLTAKFKEANQLKADINALDSEKLKKAYGLKKREKAAITAEYDAKIKLKKDQLEKSQTHVKDILEGRKNYISTEIKEEEKDIFDEFSK